MYNKRLIGERFGRHLAQYNRVASVQKGITQRIAQKLEPLGISPSSVLEIGSGSGFLTNQLSKIYPQAKIMAVDLAHESQEFLPSDVEFICTDGECYVCQEKVDLIATASTIQWFDDLQKFIGVTHNNLNNHGIVAFSTFGEENFVEILETTGEGLEYHTLEELREMVEESGFEVIESEQWQERINFGTPLDVLGHIRATGVNSIREVRMTRSDLMAFQAKYIELFGAGHLTFHPQIVIARRG